MGKERAKMPRKHPDKAALANSTPASFLTPPSELLIPSIEAHRASPRPILLQSLRSLACAWSTYLEAVCSTVPYSSSETLRTSHCNRTVGIMQQQLFGCRRNGSKQKQKSRPVFYMFYLFGCRAVPGTDTQQGNSTSSIRIFSGRGENYTSIF